MGEIFNQLYKSNVYLANRVLVDFDQDVIDALEKSGQYPDLFTVSLQRDLYRDRLVRLGVTTEQFNKIVEERNKSRISWSTIYNISLICSDSEYQHDLKDLADRIFDRDDLPAFHILDILVNDKVLYDQIIRKNHDDNFYQKQEEKYKPKRIYLEIIRLKYVFSPNTMMEDVGTWNDPIYLDEFLPAIVTYYLSDPNGNGQEIVRHVMNILAEGALRVSPSATETILYLARKGVRFNGAAVGILSREGEEDVVEELIALESDPPNEEEE
ncbi:MAG: hypothetical protein Solivirus1_38 [Solivirus sp.]|uniref:Uncharacterized protein n=1 Tax=Solivirus sp. TaxID=2487772 RepID=A0A3G5AHV4_9VIRU|nr:MAG: hypothetical protein Solivirus1_38 [Solivirus sp.]